MASITAHLYFWTHLKKQSGQRRLRQFFEQVIFELYVHLSRWTWICEAVKVPFEIDLAVLEQYHHAERRPEIAVLNLSDPIQPSTFPSNSNIFISLAEKKLFLFPELTVSR